MNLDSKASCLSRFRSWLPLANSTSCHLFIGLLPFWGFLLWHLWWSKTQHLRFPKVKLKKETPNQIAVLYDRKRQTLPKRQWKNCSQLFLRTISDPNITADPNKKPSETWSFEVRREIPSGCSAGRSVQNYIGSHESKLQKTPNKNSAPVDRIWWVYPNTQVLPLPIIHIQLVQIPHLTFHRLPRLSDAKIRLQVLHAGELIPL